MDWEEEKRSERGRASGEVDRYPPIQMLPLPIMAAASESAVSRCVNYHRKKIKKTSSAAAAAASPPSPSIATARRPSSHIDGSVEEENTSIPTIATTILALAHVVCT